MGWRFDAEWNKVQEDLFWIKTGLYPFNFFWAQLSSVMTEAVFLDCLNQSDFSRIFPTNINWFLSLRKNNGGGIYHMTKSRKKLRH